LGRTPSDWPVFFFKTLFGDSFFFHRRDFFFLIGPRLCPLGNAYISEGFEIQLSKEARPKTALFYSPFCRVPGLLVFSAFLSFFFTIFPSFVFGRTSFRFLHSMVFYISGRVVLVLFLPLNSHVLLRFFRLRSGIGLCRDGSDYGSLFPGQYGFLFSP